MFATPSAIVRFDNASLVHPGGARVLDGLTLDIERGEVLALVGRSGAGKSTALKLVNRLLLPTSGRVHVEGRDTREWQGIRLRRHIGYVLQDVGLFPHMTVADNVGVVPRLERWDTARIRARVDVLLDLVGLPAATYAARRPHELSGGQRQRVGVARALALDPVTRVELGTEFARIQRNLGTTVLVVTHDMGEAFRLATRIGVLDGGRLVTCESPSVVAASPDPRVRRLVDTLTRVPDRRDSP